MDIERCMVTSDELARYREIPIAYFSRTWFRVERPDVGLGGLRLVEETLPEERRFDYDGFDEGRVFRWARWDLGNWRLFYAVEDGVRVGGAVGAWKTEDVNMLEGRDDLAVLWDIRVDPAHRGGGIGRALVDAVSGWAIENGCVELKIETDTYNVPGCRFYSAIGCELRSIRKTPNPDYPDEHQLLWYLNLASPT